MGETNNAILKEDLGLKYPKIDSIRKARYGLFICGWCGTEFEAQIGNVRHQPHTSCGCRAGNPTHGLTKNKHFGAWRGMMARCYKPNSKAYKNYGGRGITVCDEWLDVKNFIIWAESTHPNIEGYSLDRINGNGNYEPDNCRWADRVTQNTNQRKRSTNTSGYVGVCWHKRRSKWFAQISVNCKHIGIGTFLTLEEAVQARDNYIIENKLPHKLSTEY